MEVPIAYGGQPFNPFEFSWLQTTAHTILPRLVSQLPLLVSRWPSDTSAQALDAESWVFDALLHERQVDGIYTPFHFIIDSGQQAPVFASGGRMALPCKVDRVGAAYRSPCW